MSECNCKNWENLFKRLNGIILTQQIRSDKPNGILGKDWVDFKHCPWCGKKLMRK